jgi:2-hydroxy-3-keto-5-methylthiopentenyl-1-phosphate phosphatase
MSWYCSCRSDRFAFSTERGTSSVRFQDNSYRLEFPYASTGCADMLGVCKCELARQEAWKRWGEIVPVVVIGNDTTDMCVATQAAVTFAREETFPNDKRSLANFCRGEGLTYEIFSNFGDIYRKLESLSDKFSQRMTSQRFPRPFS